MTKKEEELYLLINHVYQKFNELPKEQSVGWDQFSEYEFLVHARALQRIISHRHIANQLSGKIKKEQQENDNLAKELQW